MINIKEGETHIGKEQNNGTSGYRIYGGRRSVQLLHGSILYREAGLSGEAKKEKSLKNATLLFILGIVY